MENKEVDFNRVVTIINDIKDIFSTHRVGFAEAVEIMSNMLMHILAFNVSDKQVIYDIVKEIYSRLSEFDYQPMMDEYEQVKKKMLDEQPKT